MTTGDALAERMATAQHGYVLPAGARELLLVRHGSTGGPTVDMLMVGELSCANPPLLPIGHEQARLVALRLQSEPVSHIFITPLQRTAQTAAPLVAATGIAPIVVEELREAHLGDWEQDMVERARVGDPLVKRMFDEEDFGVIPGAETRAAFGARIRIGIARIVATIAPDSAAVAFVHGGTIGEICHQATGSRPFAFFAPENTSISRLVVLADGRWSLRNYNDTAHLAGLQPQ